MIPTQLSSHLPMAEMGTKTPFQGASMRIDTILNEIMVTETTNSIKMAMLLRKLFNELSPYLEDDDRKDAERELSELDIQVIKLNDGLPNAYFFQSQNIETALRLAKNKLEKEGKI